MTEQKDFKQSDFFKEIEAQPKKKVLDLNDLLSPDQQARATKILQESVKPLSAQEVINIMMDEDKETTNDAHTRY